MPALHLQQEIEDCKGALLQGSLGDCSLELVVLDRLLPGRWRLLVVRCVGDLLILNPPLLSQLGFGLQEKGPLGRG